MAELRNSDDSQLMTAIQDICRQAGPRTCVAVVDSFGLPLVNQGLPTGFIRSIYDIASNIPRAVDQDSSSLDSPVVTLQTSNRLIQIQKQRLQVNKVQDTDFEQKEIIVAISKTKTPAL